MSVKNKFRNWSIQELEAAIKTLEEAMASGVASASYQGGGSISYVTQQNMDSVLNRMYRALDLASGTHQPRISRIVFSSARGY